MPATRQGRAQHAGPVPRPEPAVASDARPPSSEAARLVQVKAWLLAISPMGFAVITAPNVRYYVAPATTAACHPHRPQPTVRASVRPGRTGGEA